MDLKKFFSELKRRNVYKVALTYAITAWLLAQIVALASDAFGSPDWVMKMIIFTLVIGFPIALILAWAFEMSPQGMIRTSSAAKENPNSSSKKKPLSHNVYIGILLLIIVGQFIYNKYWNQVSINTANMEKTIAVLPFRNDSPNEENVYFCNGIMEGILDHLSKIPDLSVVSRTSVEQYRKNAPSTAEIAKQLGVNYILEGSVFRVGNNSKITAQLIYAPEDRHVWSDQYDRDLEDIFSVMSDVTKTIAKELKATISPELLERIESRPTKNITAYDYYLQGKEYFNNFRLSGQEADLDNAESLYNAALELDPDFGLTYAGLARVHWDRNKFNFYKEETSVDTVLQLCNKAIALDANAADAYWVRGSFYDHMLFEIEKAEKDLKKAIEINPSHVDARLDLAFLTALHKRNFASAFKLLREAENIDRSPGQLSHTYWVSEVLYESIGDWEKTIEYHNMRKEVNPLVTDLDLIWINMDQGKFLKAQDIAKSQLDSNSILFLFIMGWTHLHLKEYNQALIYLERWKTLLKEHPDHWSATDNGIRYGMVLVENGREEEGVQMMNDELKKYDEVMKNFERMDQILYNSAAICAYLGEKERAYDYLRKIDGSLIRWDENIYVVQFDPMFDNLREDEEFKSIINDVQGEHKRIREELSRAETSGYIN